MSQLSGVRVAVVATDGFEEDELVKPVEALRDAGADVEIFSPNKSRAIQGMRHDKNPGATVRVDRTIDELNANAFDAVHLPRGTVNADSLRMIPQLQQFLKAMQRAGKPIAAICHAPWELISAGLVRDRTLTSYQSIQDDIRNAGGDWHDQEVVVDDNLITSRCPEDIPAYNWALIEKCSQRRHASATSG